jgi:hypothetical protein
VLVDPETGSIEELVAIWKAPDDRTFSDIVQLLILTGRAPVLNWWLAMG